MKKIESVKKRESNFEINKTVRHELLFVLEEEEKHPNSIAEF